jgi:pyridinium-3,5-biscarboxylic acid mononucleotide sulfurtransferase
VRVLDLSTQGTGYQRETVERLHLPFELLSDEELAFARALGLPTFEAADIILLKRLTLGIEDGWVEQVFYPVLPPTKNVKKSSNGSGSKDLERVTMDRIEERLKELEAIVAPYGSALVAFSGGVDSSLALAIAVRALSKEKVLAVTSSNETYLPSELDLAREFADSLGVGHHIINTRELDNPNYASNPANRCYFCKRTLYSDLRGIAEERGYACVVDGANADDEGDYRPGRKAAKELEVVSPLAKTGVSKAEVRELAKHLGLPSWDKPALACLSSRFPYGQEITAEKLTQVARAEEYLRARGFRQVRVRHHGEIARLEVGPEEMERAFALKEEISAGLTKAGFLYVTLDLSGYKSGSLNAALRRKGKKRPLPVIS